MPEKNADPILQAVERIFLAQVVLIASTSGLFYYAAGEDRLGFFTFVFIAGAFGASVALLRRVQVGTEALAIRLIWSWRTTLMPFLYGGIMAGIVYFLFASDILSGSNGNGLLAINLFPDFGPIKADGAKAEIPEVTPFAVSDWLKLLPSRRADAGKLIVWAFLAGYSESFVTRIMSRLEGAGDVTDDADQAAK